jgi:hypothetical protein
VDVITGNTTSTVAGGTARTHKLTPGYMGVRIALRGWGIATASALARASAARAVTCDTFGREPIVNPCGGLDDFSAELPHGKRMMISNSEGEKS